MRIAVSVKMQSMDCASVYASDRDTLLRREDQRLITGRGQFVHHLKIEGMQHVAFVRAAHARARFVLPAHSGVNCLDARALGHAPMPAPNPMFPLAAAVNHFVLPQTETSAVGQPLALVIAASCGEARDQAEQIESGVEYTLPPSATPATPLFTTELKCPTALARDDDFISVHLTHTQPRVQAVAMEPRCAIAQWLDGTLTFWCGVQAVARARDQLAQMLCVPTPQVRVIAPDVGGAFGAKASLCPEEFALALAAKHQNACLKWQSTRSEEFLAGPHGRGATLRATLQCASDGALIALRAQVQFPLGAWLPFSTAVPLNNATRILPGPYRVKHVHIEGEATPAPHAATSIYRGAGRPEATLIMERLIDLAAQRLRIDPVALRKQALVSKDAMPYATPTGQTIDSGDFARVLDEACEAFDYDNARTAQTQRRANGERIGIGVALYVEPCGQGFESARVTLHADGRVEIASGASAQGQGHETTFAQIASEALFVPTPQIVVRFGDTNTAPDGIGALASRSIAIGGSAIRIACERARVLRESGAPFPIVVDERYTAPMEAWSCGCVIAQMQIDAETGAPAIERIVWSDDAGRIISPELAHGQLIGGLAQGLGQAMMESIAYDEAGQLLTASLADYAVPRATDMPPVSITTLESTTPANALGAKGVGEAGCIGVPAALLNAAADALHDNDTHDLSFPLTSERLWRAMQRAPQTEPQ
jgi:aerobic carbon-monoxide dehydrogenase large subunit